MRKFMLSMWLCLAPLAGGASVNAATVEGNDSAQPDAAIVGPAESRRPVIAALKANDAAALIVTLHGETELASFLTEGVGETKASVVAKIAEESGPSSEREFERQWSLLAQKDGVARVSAELYPLWLAQLPQMLASANLALTAMGAAVAENESMTAVERSQLIELQWALTGWLSRTDFADRKAFEQVLGIARDWIVASGTTHPLELMLTKPERRLQLADHAIRSSKRALAVYGLDSDAILASVRFEEVSRDDRKARLRTSFAVLGVPLVFEEELAWHDGEWIDAGQAAAMQAPVETEAFDELTDSSTDEAAATD